MTKNGRIMSFGADKVEISVGLIIIGIVIDFTFHSYNIWMILRGNNLLVKANCVRIKPK